MRRIQLFGIAAALSFAAACGNTADGVKQDADNMGERAGELAGDAGNAMQGATETADIKTALMADSLVEANDLNVDTNRDTRTVTLTGTVQSQAAKNRAETVAKEQAPGYSVRNNLTIRQR
jgi:hyperosmotically inducible periplasmic protein